MRVLPIPAGVVNVFIGVTRIRVRDFLIGTILWMIPEAFFVAYVGGSISEFRILKMIFVFILMIFVYLGKNKIGNKAKQKIGF